MYNLYIILQASSGKPITTSIPPQCNTLFSSDAACALLTVSATLLSPELLLQ